MDSTIRSHNKVTSAADAVAVIQNGDALCTPGFVGIGVPDRLLKALEKRLEAAEPRDLTLVFAAGQGDGQDRGLNALGHDGLLERAIGGHRGLTGRLCVARLSAGAALVVSALVVPADRIESTAHAHAFCGA